MKRITIAIWAILLSGPLFAEATLFGIEEGPWVTNVTETSFTVLWTSKENAMVSVVIAPDDGTSFEGAVRKNYFETVAGRRLCGKRHAVTISGLEPGKSYRYRIIGKDILDFSDAYKLLYGREETLDEGWKVKTLDKNSISCSFSMLNDMHNHLDKYHKIAEGIDTRKDDFIVLNGDIVGCSDQIDSVIHDTFSPISGICSCLPVIYARGNHEGRGLDWDQIPWVYPSNTGEFYYTFRQGPVAFVVLDAGEDKPDSSTEYSGYAQYDEYRQTELEWLKKAVTEPDFASAPIKVCLMHIPALKNTDSWYAQAWANDFIVPILNNAGINLMLSGHHHELISCEAGQCGNDFPIIANSHMDRLHFKANENGDIQIDIINLDGKCIKRFNYRVRQKEQKSIDYQDIL